MVRVNLERFDLLFELMTLGAKEGYVKLTTAEFAKRIGKSQQAASIYLKELEKEGYIERHFENGSYIRLTQKGVDLLTTVYLLLRNQLEEAPTTVVIEGTVFSGLGEGAYYMSLKGYREQFLKKLGFEPYPGTLNIRVDHKFLKERDKLNEFREFAIKIEGFSDGVRTYGALWCYHALINDIRGAALIIERTHYDFSVLEVISQHALRKELGLKDGDMVRVSVFI